jgi:LytS/YehU family sensor histidine kinase
VPSLLLQPLVENSIQHGLEPKVDGGSVAVRARRRGDVLTLEVSDTGVGYSAAQAGGAGFGLTQVRERLATAYGGTAAITLIENQEGGTIARLSFPCAP